MKNFFSFIEFAKNHPLHNKVPWRTIKKNMILFECVRMFFYFHRIFTCFVQFLLSCIGDLSKTDVITQKREFKKKLSLK